MKRLLASVLATALCFIPSLHGTLVPFSMPWNDGAAGPTDASFLLHAPAGADGWILPTADGHLADSRGRVRFWGVNIVATANFPTDAESQGIAAHLAKFGFNCVRFHHLDQSWATPSLIDYTSGSRNLNAASLDALYNLSARLKERGIYWDYNLLVARHFSSADGLPAAIDTVDWSVQNNIAIFRQDMILLQKEYARKLLRTVNPYTGIAPADDPALAIVELSNENGLVQAWGNSELDAWPDYYKNDLKSSWNAWLLARYGSDAALKSAWGSLTQALGSEMVLNGSFSSGTSSWNFETHDTALATLSSGTYSGRQAARVQVTKVGSADWHVQLNQAGLSLKAGQVYTLAFSIRADSSLNAYFSVGQAHDPWQSIVGKTVAVTTSWQSVTFSFIPDADDDNMRVNLGGFGNRLCTVYLTAVSLKTGGASNLPADASLSNGTIPLLVSGGTWTLTQKRDWITFLTQIEENYFVEMRRFVREDLGYKGIVVGSAEYFSTPNIQARMDAVDAHAYWQHPVFPSVAWSSTDWTVSNVSMVNERGGTLGGLAAQRVKGKPMFVTEYQHPSPNTYSSETGILIAAYGALQDWDGIFFFDYGSDAHDWNRGRFTGFFDIDQHPPKMAGALAGAFLFARGDVSPAESEILLAMSPATERDDFVSLPMGGGCVNGLNLGLDEAWGLQKRIALSVGDSAAGDAVPAALATNALFASDTGELFWNRSNAGAGTLLVDSPCSKALVGFTDGVRRSFAGGIALTPGTTEQNWSAITLTAITGDLENLPTGTRILVATTGNVENTGMTWTSAARVSVSDDWGIAPSRVERIPAALEIPLPASHLRFRSLNGSGQRVSTLAVTAATASTALLQLGSADTLWYEIEVVAGDAYDTWSSPYFSASDIAAGLALPEADPDGDGFDNRSEYAMGLDPRHRDSPFILSDSLPPAVLVDGTEYAAFYVKNAGRNDATILAEYSEDLVSWTSAAATDASVSGFPAMKRILVPHSSGSVFVRVRAK